MRGAVVSPSSSSSRTTRFLVRCKILSDTDELVSQSYAYLPRSRFVVAILLATEQRPIVFRTVSILPELALALLPRLRLDVAPTARLGAWAGARLLRALLWLLLVVAVLRLDCPLECLFTRKFALLRKLLGLYPNLLEAFALRKNQYASMSAGSRTVLTSS